MRFPRIAMAMLATIVVILTLASTASADLGRVVVLGDSLAAGTRLGPQVPGSILSCGRSTGSYPQLALGRIKKSAAVDVSCNGGHAGVFSNSWTGIPANPAQYQYNDGTTIPPQYNSLNGSEQVVIIGSGGNEAYFGDSLSICLGHNENYDLNKCTQEFGANGAGLLTRTQGSKTIMAGVLDTVHQKSPNAKIFLVGTPRIAPPDGIGCYPNPILTLADAPVWAVWEDSLRQAMGEIAAARSSYATFVDVQAVSGNTHSACATPNMKWMNSWTVENLSYPGLANHNTPWGADAIADIIVNAIKASGLNTGTPNAPTLNRTTATASPTQSFTYSGAVGSTFKCRLDNAAYAACPSSPVTLTGLANGPHTYSVTQTDGSGNLSPASIVNFTVDNVAPSIPTLTRTNPTASPTSSPTQTFTYSGAESGGTFQCKLDSNAYAACPASPATISGLASGSHTYYLTHTDAAGNVSPVRSVTWTVDVTPPGPPTVTRTNPTADPTKSTTQVITYSGAEAGGTFQCKLDSGSFGACSGGSVTLTGLGAGTHTYSVTQTDAVGNLGSATTVTWTVDLTLPSAPTVTRTVPSNSPTNSPTQVLTYVGAEAGGTFQCKLDSAAYAACPASPVTLNGLGAGSHVYSVTQTDSAGNVGAVGTASWTIDGTAPPVPNVSGPSGITALNTASIIYSDSEAGVSFDCKLDTAAYADCPSSPISLSGLPAGAHTYYVTATDAAGNVSNPGTATWTIDPSGFTSSITANPSNPSTSPTATFSFAASVTAGTTYECKLDSGAFASCASPKTYNNLPDGTHTFTVRASNASTTPTTTPDVSRTWVIDATPPGAPTLNRTSPTANPTNSTSQTFSLARAEAGGVLNCKLDNEPITTCPSSPITVAGLDNGPHSYSVTQTDDAGNTGSAATVSWTVDTISPNAPTVTRTAPTVTPTSSTSQTITYGGIEASAITQCKLDTGAFGSCSASGFTLTSLSEGSHTFSITQTDTAGNTSPAGSVSWSIDSIAPGAPTLIRDVPTVALTNSSSQTLSFSAAEAGGTLKCKLDSAAYAACPASPVTLTALGHGQHTYSVTQTDATGNTSQVSSVTWTVDLIAPLSPGPIQFGLPAFTNEDSAAIGYTPKEAGGDTQCQIDFGPWITCASNPLLLTNLDDGNHNVAIRQVDGAGNIGAGAQVSWLVDTVKPEPPTVTRTSPTTSPSNQTAASLTIDAAELAGTLHCKLDGAAYTVCPSSPVALSSLGFGSHTYSVTQTDAAGNVSNPGTATWIVEPDTLPPAAPTVTRTTPTASPTTSTSQSIAFSAAESGGTLKCKLDAAAYANCASSPITLNGLANGSHTYSVTQTDSSGNVSPAGSVTWSIDNTPPGTPTVTRTTPSGNPTPSTSQTLTYSGAESGGTFQCKLDSEPWAACPSSPVLRTGLNDGPHTFSVTQTDALGNLGSATTVTWTVDTSAPPTPEVERSSPAANPTNSPSQTIIYSGEPGGSFQCKLDSANYAPCPASPVNLTGLSNGSHSFSVTQTDALGNTSAATTVTWTVDTVAPGAPTVTRSSPAGTPTNLTSQTITYSGIEPGATTQCKLDSAASAPCGASPFTLNGLSSGTHNLTITQTDPAGNVSATGAVSWVVDVTAPQAPSVSGPSGNHGLTTATISYSNPEAGVTFQCRLDSAAYAPCPASPVSLTGLANGAHTYYVTATDSAGNASAAGTVSWNVDTTGFSVSITTAPISPSTMSTASFEFEPTIISGTTYECKLDSAAFTSCSSPKTYPGLTNGSHTFAVRAVNAGQYTPEASRTWDIDSTAPNAPTLQRTSPTASPTSSLSQTLSIVGAEPGGVLSCSVNGSAYLHCGLDPSNSVTLPPQSDGVYNFSARQTDSAGNTGPAATVTWVIDTVSPAVPTVVRTSPTASPTSSTSQTITYAGEAASTFECSIDGASYEPCQGSPLTLTGLSLGSHAVSVRQFDAAGNAGPTAAVAWTVEAPSAAPPVVTDPAQPSDPSKPAAALSAKFSSFKPKSIVPARSGPPFSLKSRGTVGSFGVTLSAPATISLRLERVTSGATRSSSSWTKFKLKSGKTKIYLSGRANGRPLAAGAYKVHLTSGGAKTSVLSQTFRIKR